MTTKSSDTSLSTRSALGVISGSAEPLSCNKRLVGYVSSLGTKAITTLQASYLTHIIYAFIDMKSDGSLVVAAESEPRLQQLMQVQNATGFRLKTLFAVGGWGNSQYFSATAASPSLRSNFIRDVVTILQKHNFDGVDVD